MMFATITKYFTVFYRVMVNFERVVDLDYFSFFIESGINLPFIDVPRLWVVE